MIDPQLLRDNPDAIRASQVARRASVELVDEAIAADAARRTAIATFESLRAEQNLFGKTVASAPKEQKKELVAQAQELAARVKAASQASAESDAEFERIVGSIANPILPGVPAGGEDDFELLKTVGEKPTFDFTPRDHLELGELLGAIDTGRGAKVSGARFSFLTGIGARLELALMNMGLDRAIEAGFIPLITPTLVKPEIMRGTGFLGEHADEIYYLPADDLYLTGTSEVALAGFHADEILDLERGPLRYAGWSTCYRREAGSGGKDTRGIIRVHQFNKLEMFSYVHPDAAEAEHAALLEYQEQMLQSLGLSYRVIDTAAGDLGTSAARKFDVEAWVPTQNAYRELTSTSNCTTFQARRLDIRFRTESGKTTPVATLNGTLATTRWIVALLETHQRADGSVVVPEALRPYLGGIEVIEPVARNRCAGRRVTGVAAHDRLLIALDIDGTVMHETGEITDAVVEQVARVASLGHEVMLSTGRSVAMTLPVLERLGLTSEYVVCSNGAITLRRDADAPTGYRREHVETFDPSRVLTTIRGALEKASYAVEDEDGFYRYTGSFPDSSLGAISEQVPFEKLLTQDATRVVVISPEHDMEEFLTIVEQMGLHQVSYNVGWTAWLDIAPDGVNKSTAMERVRALLEIPRSNVIAMGDGRNDIEMLHWAASEGRGISMGQAPDEVHAAANERTSADIDDGVARVLAGL